MIHGRQKMTLTHASVQSAVENYLNDHFSVPVSVKSWAMTPNTYGDAASIDIEFEQEIQPEEPNASPTT